MHEQLEGCVQGILSILPTTKIIKPSINLHLQFSTFKSANSLCSYIVFLFPCPFLTLHEHSALFFPHPYILKLHPVSQAVFTSALNTSSTHTYTHTHTHIPLSTGHRHLSPFPHSVSFPLWCVVCPLAEVAHLFSVGTDFKGQATSGHYGRAKPTGL